jgi:hypothetical protein
MQSTASQKLLSIYPIWIVLNAPVECDQQFISFLGIFILMLIGWASIGQVQACSPSSTRTAFGTVGVHSAVC